ncbi:MAG: DUF5112 domain-containing protein [Clostridium sp.]|nr:DUF5112 domain-containing protein [Clostridium sp.]
MVKDRRESMHGWRYKGRRSRMATYRLAAMLTLFCVCLPLWSLGEVESRVDSLNTAAYRMRYRDVASSQALARHALKLASDYPDGYYEALNHIAYVAYQQMNFGQAMPLAARVRRESGNQIEALVADVTLMKICQRTSRNRQFYQYRGSAARRLHRIDEESDRLTERERERMRFARSEYHIVSSTYFYYLGQLPQALTEINALDETDNLRGDTAQWIYYNYMKGSGGLCEGDDPADVVLREFDYLFKSFTLSKVAGYRYFEGNNLQALATLLHRPQNQELVRYRRPDSFAYLCNLFHLKAGHTAELGECLARRAWERFVAYGDLYQTACACRTMGELRFDDGDYDDALRHFTRALGYVNRHHRRYYPADTLRTLCPYAGSDTSSVEMQWMNDTTMLIAPEWIASIRERLSMAYSALDDKLRSDYNRNIYLDILEQTRQDREWESRYEELRQGSRSLSVLLVSVIVLIVLLVFSCVYLYCLGRRRNRRQVALLEYVLEACREVMWSGQLPEKSDGRWTREEWDTISRLLQPYAGWAEENRSVLQQLGDERRQVAEQRMVSEQRIARSKRRNVENRAKLSLVYAVIPFIDRIRGEANRLRRGCESPTERLDYIKELAGQINLYNDILAEWIQMRRGELSLHIGTFALQEVLDVVAKGHLRFRQSGLTLNVMPTDAVVKADKALTLFMVNTLADNARKFTPQGGSVTVEATVTDDRVELRVTDTGCGLTADEIDRILTSKVYDASEIGGGDSFVRERKGHGFGLMNCKGIIEKYRKTSDLFRVCTFFITGRKGQGCSFGFSLPKGTLRMFAALFLALAAGGNAEAAFTIDRPAERATEMLSAPDSATFERHLREARRYADSLYFANVDGDHRRAIAFSDSTFRSLSACYRSACPEGHDVLQWLGTVGGTDVPAEIRWWLNEWHGMDYTLLLGWRNETAVAALALHDWPLYRYNNDVYTQLYKYVSQDQELPAYCEAMTTAQTNKRVGLALLVFLSIAGLSAVYIFYFRRTLLFRMNLAQLVEINRRLLAPLPRPDGEEQEVDGWLHTLWRGLSEIHAVCGIRLTLNNGDGGRSEIHTVGDCDKAGMQLLDYPWRLNGQEHVQGMLQITVPQGTVDESDRLTDEMAVNCLAALFRSGPLRRARENEELQQAEDEHRRARYEESVLHVQNQILDNCLSTVKHEAMYYPGRICRLAGRLSCPDLSSADRRLLLDELNEWVDYYRTLYTLLGRQAERQLTEVKFRRRPCRVDGLLHRAARVRLVQGGSLSVDNRATVSAVTGDADLLDCLLEILLRTTAEDCVRGGGEPMLTLHAADDGLFVRFTLHCPALTPTAEELHNLFMPHATHIPYLISKQIIREHDALSGHCGCRINAEATAGGGYGVWFTLPKSKENESL